MKKFLIVKMWALGDILMATPLLNGLRSGRDPVHISWLVDATHADALVGNPLVDDVIVVDSMAWRKQLRRNDFVGWLRTGLKITKKLRDEKFDAVLNFHPDKWWTLFFVVGKQKLAFFEFPNLHPVRLLYNKFLIKLQQPAMHNSEHYMSGARLLGFVSGDYRMSIGRSEDGLKFADEILGERPDKAGPIIVLAPFSSAANKNWPIERYIELGHRLIAEHNATIVVTAGPGERDEAARIIKDLPANRAIFPETTSVRQYIALLRKADLVVSGDSSPVHIAAAAGVPFVTLFGPTPIEELAPLSGNGRIVHRAIACSPCRSHLCKNQVFRQCMTAISIEDVLVEIRSVFQSPAESRTLRNDEWAWNANINS